MKTRRSEVKKITVYVPNRGVTTSIEGKLPSVPVSLSMPPWVSKSIKGEKSA
jgi:hypothetical protein